MLCSISVCVKAVRVRLRPVRRLCGKQKYVISGAIVLSLLLGGFWPGQFLGAAEKLSLKYIPSTPVAAAVVYPKRMFDRKEFELMPLEVLQAVGLQELGLDPLQVEQIVFFGVPNPLINPPVDYGLVVRFAQPVDQGKALQQLPLRFQQKTYKGLTLNVPTFDRGPQPPVVLPSYCWADEKTLLVATNWTLKMMITADGTNAESPLLRRLAQQDDSADLLVVVAMTPLRAIITGTLGALREQLPSQLEPFQEVPALVEVIELEAIIKSTSMVALHHICDDQADAKELEGLLQQGRQLGESLLDQQVARLSQSSNAEERAIAKYIQRIRQPLIDLFMPKRRGRKLTTRVEFQPNLPQLSLLSGILVPAAQAARLQAERERRKLLKQRSLQEDDPRFDFY